MAIFENHSGDSTIKGLVLFCFVLEYTLSILAGTLVLAITVHTIPHKLYVLSFTWPLHNTSVKTGSNLPVLPLLPIKITEVLKFYLIIYLKIKSFDW